MDSCEWLLLMKSKISKYNASNNKKLLWVTAAFLCVIVFLWIHYLRDNISIKCLFKSSTFVYDSQNNVLIQKGFVKIFETGKKKITYKIPYNEKPEIAVIRKSPDAHLVTVEDVYSDHVIVRKTDSNDFTGDDYEWIATGNPRYPPEE